MAKLSLTYHLKSKHFPFTVMYDNENRKIHALQKLEPINARDSKKKEA